MYLVSDPLGLLGGEQTYRYVPNPCGWVDPLGLAASSKISSLMDYIGDGRRVSGHTGFLDGVRLSRSQINNIAKEMEKLGIKVIRKADKYLHQMLGQLLIMAFAIFILGKMLPYMRCIMK